MDRILQEISAAGRRLEGMDSMMTSLTEDTKSMRLDIAGFQSRVTTLEQRVTTVEMQAALVSDRDQELLYLHRECDRVVPITSPAASVTSVSGKPDTSLPRSHVSMGTLLEPMPRFPVPRETPKDFRAGEPKGDVVRGDEEEGVEGENGTEPAATEERVRREKAEAEAGHEEKETTHGRVPESGSPGTSHDPGGSWLTKDPSTAEARRRRKAKLEEKKNPP
ncbi:hypothetical protein NDU88_000359 [Pleurodeles waltl]|uniref:Uncharacterized protein n=1 Tax=Pleurodeles waltl TaxID=8319 RepID=A0AAV7UTU1_PLEWA|nr:hypothetical protein NDU88_000359 [Pleurodeles waltl]